jgi:hypothetical protein
MSRQHVSADEQAEGVVLACRIMPESDLVLEVLGKMQKCVCTARPIPGPGSADE